MGASKIISIDSNQKQRGVRGGIKVIDRKMIIVSMLLISSIIFPCVSNSPVTLQTQDPIKIGIFAPFATASLLYCTPWIQQGFELGLIYATTEMGYDNENMTKTGRSYELYYYDTKGSPTEATSLAISAIETDGIDILVGGVYDSVASAIANVAENYEKLYFITPASAVSHTGSDFNPYIFRIARNGWHDAFADVTYAMDYLNCTTFAFLAADYSFGYEGVELRTDVIDGKGGSVVNIQYASLFTTDFGPYMTNLLSAESTFDIDCLFIIWQGDYSYLYADLDLYDIRNYMNISVPLFDFLSMNMIEASLTPPLTFENTTGSCPYGYELPNNIVNDWMVAQHLARNISPNDNLGLPQRIPELYTASAFATAQFLVNVTNAITNLNTNAMINYLESGLNIACPKGETYLRPDDHQGLAEMYIARAWNDARSGSETEGYIIPQLVETLNRSMVAPPIESLWNGEPYVPGGFADIIPPNISSVVIEPSTPYATNDVLVTAIVTDVNGVDHVNLLYVVNEGTIWAVQTMEHPQIDTWTGTIPAQAAGSNITYIVIANDTFGNWNFSPVFSYVVQQAPPTETTTTSPITSATTTTPPPSGEITAALLVLGGIGCVVVIIIVILFMKKEKI
jgi:branched-chain amino acid transport system substrate-binding protein